jgi:hypothetical protein
VGSAQLLYGWLDYIERCRYRRRSFYGCDNFWKRFQANDALGANVAVDRCGIGHKLATASGFVASIAIGGAMGAEAAEANAGKKGFEFSHWIPDRLGGPRCRQLLLILISTTRIVE